MWVVKCLVKFLLHHQQLSEEVEFVKVEQLEVTGATAQQPIVISMSEQL